VCVSIGKWDVCFHDLANLVVFCFKICLCRKRKAQEEEEEEVKKKLQKEWDKNYEVSY